MAELIYDQFKINDKYHLNSEDYANLSKLYLPIMGIDSFALYNVLSSLEIDKEYTYKNILDLLTNFSLSTLNQALDKLEALGLVKTYHSKKNGYIHQLFAPLSQNDFLENELLCAILTSQIGSVAVSELKTSKENFKDYKEVTKKFVDVFSIDTNDKETVITNLFKPTIIIDNKDFNYVLFKAELDNKIPEDVLEDNDFKQHILRIAYTYKLNADEMQECVLKTMDIDKNLEYASISKNAKIAYQNKYLSKEPVLKTLNDDNYLSSVKNDAWYDLLNAVENMGIADVLYSLSGVKPSVAEISMFEKLQSNTNFPTGVINLMIIKVSSEKKGELPSYNYFEKIANTWARAKIKTAYDVLKYYENKNEDDRQMLKDNYKKVEKKKPILPSWYEAYKTSLDENTNKEMNDEQTKQIVDLVKDLFNS